MRARPRTLKCDALQPDGLIALAAAAIMLPVMAVEEQARTRAGELRLEQFLELRRPMSVAVAQDGQSVAFAVSTAYSQKGKRPESHIWIAGLDGSCRQATG